MALADPDTVRMNLLAKGFHVPAERCFDSAEALLARPRLADVMIIATQDRQHVPEALRRAGPRLSSSAGKAHFSGAERPCMARRTRPTQPGAW